MDELHHKTVACDDAGTPARPNDRRWPSCEVSHVEIPISVSSDANHRLFRPILICLGYAPASERPGLVRWVSGTGRSSLVLIETSAPAQDFDESGSKPNIARGLVFEADRRERIDTLYELVLSLGLAVLVPPARYSSGDREYGVVWCDTSGTIFELRYRALTASVANEPIQPGE